MKTAMFCLCLLAAFFSAGIAKRQSAQQLWKEQMDRIDKHLAEARAKEENASRKKSKMIGLPHFDIAFDTEEGSAATAEDISPITVHSLRPQDIDIVGAMGDSITAANGAGANTVAGLAIEYRGICYSIGGDAELEQSLTLPNILKKFNPRLDGYSVGNGPNPINKYPDGFNVAVPGARADDMKGQADDLVNRLKTDNRSQFETDWKLVTLFIGGNDLCALGRDPEGASPETYVAEIKKGLDVLHAEVPRMLVNIVDIMEIYVLPYVAYGYGSTIQCRALQNSFCGHVVGTYNDTEKQNELIAINKQYQTQLQDLIDSGIYDTRDDFTVVIQPFFRDTVLPYTEDGEVDATYFAPDCFHFSDIGHAMGAANLWNNMLEPVGNKSTVWTISDLKIPTEEHPYIFTSKNSIPKPTSPPIVITPEVITFTPKVITITSEVITIEEVPGWAIGLICVFGVGVLGELCALVYILQKNKKSKKASIKSVETHVNKSYTSM